MCICSFLFYTPGDSKPSFSMWYKHVQTRFLKFELKILCSKLKNSLKKNLISPKIFVGKQLKSTKQWSGMYKKNVERCPLVILFLDVSGWQISFRFQGTESQRHSLLWEGAGLHRKVFCGVLQKVQSWHRSKGWIMSDIVRLYVMYVLCMMDMVFVYYT